MKKLLLLFVVVAFACIANAQNTPGPVEKKLSDSLCNALSRLDLSKISTAQEAKEAFMKSFMQYSDMFIDLAKERNVSIDDQQAMHNAGTDIAKNLMAQKCESFLKLAVKMAAKDSEEDETVSATGLFKRIENKGFNYFVISSDNKKEQSFIWLRQFPGSESYMQGGAKLIGKKIKIKYREMEVYLPAAQGYYKVKEVVALELL